MLSNPLVSQRLSRRERQIMDVIYRRERASASDVLGDLPDPPSYSSVRTLLRILEEKGHLSHIEEGQRYIYVPTQQRQSAAKSAIEQVVTTFFGGSVELAVSALLTESETNLTDDELARLESIIQESQRRQKASNEEAGK
jgi:predicted transcriptional regulator